MALIQDSPLGILIIIYIITAKKIAHTARAYQLQDPRTETLSETRTSKDGRHWRWENIGISIVRRCQI